jgi:hypothetical protein
MTPLAHGLVVLMLVLAPMLRGVAHAQEEAGYGEGEYEEPAPQPGDFEAALAPYGSWIEDDQYGQVWEPAVSVGWAPYVDGYWASTPYGWTWVSYEPWAWTFHYGRWALLPSGWGWVPGSVWGPAWVDWFWSNGFVGWAPLAPFGSHVAVIDPFVFCHVRDFGSHHLAHIVVNHHLLPDRVIHRWQQRDPGHQRPPSLHQVERVSQHQITRLDHRPPGTLAPRSPLPGRQLVRPAREQQGGGPHRLGHAWAPGGPRPGEATLGHPWEPGRVTRAPDAGGSAPPESRVSRLARPNLAPALGGARRLPPSAVGRPAPTFGGPGAGAANPHRPLPSAGVTRHPPAVLPGGSVAHPASGLTGAQGRHAPEASHGFVGAR